MPYFIYKTTPKQPEIYPDQLQAHERHIYERHLSYLRSLLNQNSLILAGNVHLSHGEEGYVILQAESEQQARRLMDADPAVHSRLVEAELFPMELDLVAARIHSLPK